MIAYGVYVGQDVLCFGWGDDGSEYAIYENAEKAEKLRAHMSSIFAMHKYEVRKVEIKEVK